MKDFPSHPCIESHQVKVLYFAKARELAGTAEEQVEFPGTELNAVEILQYLCARLPALSQVKDQALLSLNLDFIQDYERRLLLKSGDEIAVIPPLSGG